jgi:prepilin-type processing-associated H-X9-DG protein/prepilin-type N-terminal cleavage/methylation domain-containing protein
MYARFASAPHRARAGFTLLEMLVVIGIILTLAGLLFPAINAARESARSTQCTSNLRQLGIAVIQYQDQYKQYPPYRWEDPAVINQYGVDRPRWQWIMADYTGRWAQNPNAILAAGPGDPTYTNVPLDNEILMCPSMSYGFNNYSIRNGSYGYNFQYLGNSRNMVDGNLATPMLNFPVNVVKDPAHTIAFGDSRGGGSPHGGHSMTLDPPHMRVRPDGATVNSPYWLQAPWSGTALAGVDPYGPDEGTPDIAIPFSSAEARHRGRANVVFLDGHAESRKLEELGYVVVGGIAQMQSSNRLPWGDNSLWTGRGLDETSPFFGAP